MCVFFGSIPASISVDYYYYYFILLSSLLSLFIIIVIVAVVVAFVIIIILTWIVLDDEKWFVLIFLPIIFARVMAVRTDFIQAKTFATFLYRSFLRYYRNTKLFIAD